MRFYGSYVSPSVSDQETESRREFEQAPRVLGEEEAGNGERQRPGLLDPGDAQIEAGDLWAPRQEIDEQDREIGA